MEVLIIAGVLGAGYVLNKNGLQRDEKIKTDLKTPSRDKPNGDNIYQSNRALEIRKNEQQKANELFSQTKNSEATNVMIPGPPEPIFNKTDYSSNNLPIEFNDTFDKGDQYSNFINEYTGQISSQESKRVSAQQAANNTYVTGPPTTGGWNGVQTEGQGYGAIKSLTGNMLNPQDFKHNNMVPFFGGSVKQNVDDTAHSQTFENFTGQQSLSRPKTEIAPMFNPTANFTNVNGMQNFSQMQRERYYVSNKQNNVAPPDSQVIVGPGLNKGFTANPSGGFQQADTRDYVLPKTVDQLRVKTNPKVTYHSRIVSGKSISRPGKIGTVVKNKPDTFYIHGHDRLFTTTGATKGSKQRPKIVLKYTNRNTTELKRRVGAAAPTKGSQQPKRGKVRITRKVQNGSYGMRNADAAGTWSSKSYDYGKKRIKLVRTNRQTLGQCQTNKNMQNTAGSKRNMGKINPTLRRTRKTNVTGNPHWASNVQAPHNRHTVYDPNDTARTTIKETLIHDARDGNISSQRPAKPTVYDPNDTARTTIKETLIHDARDGNISSQRPAKPTVYDPNDTARTTIKETNIDDNRFGQAHNSQFNESYVIDPNDKAKKTMKQTTIDDNRFGPAAADDTNLGGYQTNPRTAPTTHRESQLSSYTGDANKPGSNGYQIASVDMKNTARQFTTTDYTGTAGAVDNQAPASRIEYNNATTTSHRQEVSQGRAPTSTGPKTYIAGDDINASTTKNTTETNEKLNKRGAVTTRVTSSIPQPSQCGVTHEKIQLPNKPLADRLDPATLNAFRENPYTQSLNSFAFN